MKPVPLRPFGVVGAWLIALFWAGTGMSKLVGLWLGSAPNAEPTWADQFGVTVIGASAVCEIAAALLIFAGLIRTGIVVTLGLLAAFSLALVIVPPEPGQSCGCGGVAELDVVDPIIRNAILASLGLFVLVLNGRAESTHRRSDGPQIASSAPQGAARAFSLIELLVVIAVLGTLLAIALPMLSHGRQGARRSACLRQLASHGVVLQAYMSDNSDYWPYPLKQNRYTPPLPHVDVGDPYAQQLLPYGVVGGLWHIVMLSAYAENPFHESLLCPSHHHVREEWQKNAELLGLTLSELRGTTSDYSMSMAMYLDPAALDPESPSWEERYFRGTRADEVVHPAFKASLYETQPWHHPSYDPDGAGWPPIPATYNVLAVDGSGGTRNTADVANPVLPVPETRPDILPLRLETEKFNFTPLGVRGRDW